MKARQYTKRIGFYQTVAVADGYGGSTVSETLVATSWAKIETAKSSQRLTELGITDPLNTLIITTRFRNDIDYNAINQFIKYRGVNYIMKGTVNENFEDVDVQFIATKQMTDSVEEL